MTHDKSCDRENELLSEMLTDEEVYEITRKRRPTAQSRQLNRMGIHFETRGDGTLLVLWGDVYKHRQHTRSHRAPKEVVMNLSAI